MTTLDSDTLTEYLPDGPITSLRRIQTLYGVLEEAAGDKGSSKSEFDLYFTPGKLNDFTTRNPSEDDRYLVTVEIDLTGDKPLPQDVNIRVEAFTPDKIPLLGYANYWPGAAIDHSITHRGSKSGADIDTVVTYCTDRLNRWTNADDREPAIGEVADTHPDGWVIKRLQTLGRNKDVLNRIESQVHRKCTNEGKFVTTVRLQLNSENLAEKSADSDIRWYYPGEIHVLNAGMKARKEEKLARKNLDDSDPPSRGNGVCMVTGEKDDVFGTTDDPFNFFTVQHAEKFDELKRSNSWRNHSVSANAALLLQSGESLAEACRTTRNGLGVYTLPYFVEMDERRANTLYSVLTALQNNEIGDGNDHPMFALENGIENHGTDADKRDLRFYVISLRNDSGDINVIHEVPDVSLYHPREAAKAHEIVLDGSTAFGLAAGFEKVDGWEPITPNTTKSGVLNSIVSGRYAWGTMPLTAGDDGAMADDAPEWLTYQLLTGRSVPADRLFDAYVDRIEQERRENDEHSLPSRHIRTQFAQFEALARANRLETSNDQSTLTTFTDMDDELPSREEVAGDGNLSKLAARKYRLERFLDARGSLKNSERRTAFLLGVLTGMTSHHQRATRGMNRTVIDQYPPDQITLDRLVTVFPEISSKCHVYASEVSWAGDTLFPEVLDELTDTETDILEYPNDWTLPLREVRFFYALGVTYGQRADRQAHDLVEALGGTDDENTPNDTTVEETA
ncbi:hypothetical protein A4G99_24050 [Haladaptatus sp. R4]|uniref:TM1802 family CRISPR-associated protein n=1 Tax=Haladaptatus sp. R4 TaxID=1679489 RepID=UPI0007B4C085|nr:TM1802 family CRISPR-associated protein [Haladaptatus sp. R4]KZN24965.1 hypothetical protein A4G99_24050 [Haladaptatus sp. R4]